jgi:hypothetical protein
VIRRALELALGLSLSLEVLGCSSTSGEQPATAASQRGEPVLFTLGTLDGGEVSSDTTRGRTTALLFITTYDLPSQAEAQLLREVLSTHKPVANAAIVVMEPPHSAALAQVWAEALNLKWPIAMASPLLLSGDSQLGRIGGVPTLIVLDRRGRLAARLDGAAGRQAVRDALSAAEVTSR